jgi:hypothetical protein
MAHPIRPESYIKMDNFYTLTVYEKGRCCGCGSCRCCGWFLLLWVWLLSLLYCVVRCGVVSSGRRFWCGMGVLRMFIERAQ